MEGRQMRRMPRQLASEIAVLMTIALLTSFVASIAYSIIQRYEQYEYARGYESTAYSHPTNENTHAAAITRSYLTLFEKDS